MDSSQFISQNTDTSLNIDATMSAKEFKGTCLEKLRTILSAVFSDNYEKQKVKVGYDTFQFACPFCRDSAVSSQKKRGNFIFKDGPFLNSFKCFNCNTFMPITKFFRKFDENLPLAAIDYISKHKPTALDGSPLAPPTALTETVFGADAMESLAVDKERIKGIYGLSEIEHSPRVMQYLLGRKIGKFGNFLYDPKSDSLLILNLVRGKVVSFQIRALNPNHKGGKYITISLRDIHIKLLRDGVTVTDEQNSRSMIYNLFNINPRRPVLATEGPIDSMFLPNCIALLGASKTVNVGLPLYYVYDDDEKGREEAMKKLRKGCNVFMWEKLRTDYPTMPKKAKWDINDFIIWCTNANLAPPRFWSKYFSNDSLDILEI